MKYIDLINLVDLSSNAFLEVLDYAFERGQFYDGKIFVDLSKKEFRDIFIFEFLRKIVEHNQFGKISIFLSTCRPIDNWRNKEKKITKRVRYDLVDDSIVVDLNRLDMLIDRSLKQLVMRGTYHILSYKELDIFDMTTLLKKSIGTACMETIPTKFLTLQDSNSIFDREESESFPAYLVGGIETIATDKGLI